MGWRQSSYRCGSLRTSTLSTPAIVLLLTGRPLRRRCHVHRSRPAALVLVTTNGGPLLASLRGVQNSRRRRPTALATAEEPAEEPPWIPPGSGDGAAWEWGEIYVWGGVTWTPGEPASLPKQLEEEEEQVLERELAGAPAGTPALRQRVWAAVSEQYPAASRGGRFAGKPVSPVLTSLRFARLVEVLGISGEDAAELVEIDATPLLVEPEGVACAFKLISGISSRVKALELVRCHPGLLVGGVTSLKEGAGLVSSALIDLLFAGRLLWVLEDRNKDDQLKLAEIEFYARVAAFFKPVMDLVQRRTAELLSFLSLVFPIILQAVALACIHTLYPGALRPESWGPDLVLWDLSLAAWLIWFSGQVLGLGPLGPLGPWALDLGSSTLSLAAWLLSLASYLLGLLPLGAGLGPWALALLFWLLYLASWALGLWSSVTLLP